MINYLSAQEEDQTSTNTLADVAESETNIKEGDFALVRARNTGATHEIDVLPLYRFRQEESDGSTGLSAWTQLGPATTVDPATEVTFSSLNLNPLIGAVKLQVESETDDEHSDCEVSGYTAPVVLGDTTLYTREKYKARYIAADTVQASTNDPTVVDGTEIPIGPFRRFVGILTNTGAETVSVTFEAQYIKGSSPSAWTAVPTASAVTITAGGVAIVDSRSLCPTADRLRIKVESTVDGDHGELTVFGASARREFFQATIANALDPEA